MSLTFASPADFSAFPWMRYALQEYGQREVAGKKQNNRRILMYHATVGNAQEDEVPWCSAFANWCMKRAGIHGSGRANARSWLSWGKLCLDPPIFGCVAVFSRARPWQGHVAFYVGAQHGKIVVLGGNQKDSVCVAEYPRGRLLGYRWPVGFPIPQQGAPYAVAAAITNASTMG